MKSQISLAFEKCKRENRPALLTYTVAGDNSKKKSLEILKSCLLYTSPSPRDRQKSRMPSSA